MFGSWLMTTMGMGTTGTTTGPLLPVASAG
jgi:hypothetical protein